jgi:hypothetical protein
VEPRKKIFRQRALLQNQSNVYQRLHRAGPKWTRRLSFTVPVPTPRQEYRQLETTPGTDKTPHLQQILLEQWKS